MRFSALAVAAATALAASCAAHAADAPPVLRASAPTVEPAAPEGGWYLRGDIGAATSSIGDFGVYQNGERVGPGVGTTTRYDLRTKSFSETVSVGLGIGYQFNSWFRVDVTGELRAGGRLRAMDYVEFGGGSTMTNTYEGGVRSWVGLANVYVDLGTFCTLGCLTPYLGAGIGFASHTVSGFTDVSAGVGSLGGYAATTSKTSFAWALMAGLGYKVNERLSLELGYRYLHLGDLPSLALRDPATGLPPVSGDTIRVRNLSAHEIRLGMRWMLNCACAAPAPIVARY